MNIEVVLEEVKHPVKEVRLSLSIEEAAVLVAVLGNQSSGSYNKAVRDVLDGQAGSTNNVHSRWPGLYERLAADPQKYSIYSELNKALSK